MDTTRPPSNAPSSNAPSQRGTVFRRASTDARLLKLEITPEKMGQLATAQISQLDAWSKRLKQQQWEMENKIDDENKELRRTERKIQEFTRKYEKLCSELNAKTSERDALRATLEDIKEKVSSFKAVQKGAVMNIRMGEAKTLSNLGKANRAAARGEKFVPPPPASPQVSATVGLTQTIDINGRGESGNASGRAR